MHQRMGGKLIENAKRLDAETYQRVCRELTELLAPLFKRITVPLSVFEKSSHGDIDFVVSGAADPKDVQARLASPVVMKNGPTVSYDYQGHQIDIHTAPDDEFDICVVYKQYGDLGNLLGRIAKRLGLSYGMNGLTLRAFNREGEVHLGGTGPDQFEKWSLTTDPRRALEYLGYSWARYQEGFRTELEAFEYIVGGRYFSPDVYLDRSTYNGHTHDRNRKRPMFQRFIKYLQDLGAGIPQGAPPPSPLETVLAFGLSDRLDALRQKVRDAYLLKQRLNAKLVIELTGLSGRALGQCMDRLRSVVNLENSEDEQWLRDTIVRVASELPAAT